MFHFPRHVSVSCLSQTSSLTGTFIFSYTFHVRGGRIWIVHNTKPREGETTDINSHKFPFHDPTHSLFVFPCLGQQAALSAFHTVPGSTSLCHVFLWHEPTMEVSIHCGGTCCQEQNTMSPPVASPNHYHAADFVMQLCWYLFPMDNVTDRGGSLRGKGQSSQNHHKDIAKNVLHRTPKNDVFF